MIRFAPSMRALAVCLAFLAGYVDALGFLATSGFFVSFMSGNSTRLAVGLAGARAEAVAAGTLILCFVSGVILGAVTGAKAGPRQSAAVLLLVALLLGGAAAVSRWSGLWTPGLLAIAMGAENAVVEREGEAPLGVTYMTGSLVRVGFGLSGLITGRRHAGWTGYALLWAGLVGGALAGASLFPMLRQDAMLLASSAAGALAIWAWIAGTRIEA
ncbi:YoaK family protein [Sphingobium olei]|uniref:YoaK family protein n=1 Tax=Sphingobium olei TaxID=420955 RepID=A0ABW3P243_9SPHN